MNKMELNNIKVPDGLSSAVEVSIKKAKSHEVKRKAIFFNRLAAIVMVFALLGGMIAFNPSVQAAVKNVLPWDVFSFWQKSNANLSPDAHQLSQEDITQEGGVTELATFTVSQSVFDTQRLHIMVDVKPANPDILLLACHDYTDSIRKLGSVYKKQNDMSIKEYAENNNKQIVMVNMIADENGFQVGGSGTDFKYSNDGTLTLKYVCQYEGAVKNDMPMQLYCSAKSLFADNQEGTTVSYKLKVVEKVDTVSSTQSVVFSKYGISVDHVTLIKTPLAVYSKVYYSVVDKETYDNLINCDCENDELCENLHGGECKVNFEFLDKNGTILGWSDTVSSGSIEWDSEKMIGIDMRSIPYTDTLPDEIIIGGFTDKNMQGSKGKYTNKVNPLLKKAEVHTITLK